MYQLRDYQKNAADSALRAFSKGDKNGVIILPTGSGKSLVIAEIASKLESPLLVFCPSKEILEQNYSKYMSYGFMNSGIYSASVGIKDINKVTFATIGSAINHIDEFDCFRYVLIDECHQVNSEGGMYKTFIESKNRIVVGLTATPYRLSNYGPGCSILKFITRSRPRIFSQVLYYCQVKTLEERGYLAKLKYYDITSLDLSRIKPNSTGADFDESSLRIEYKRSDYYTKLVNTVHRLLHPKSGVPRKGILVFTRFVEEAQMLADSIGCCEIVTGNTSKKDRERILSEFKEGRIKVVSNVGVLTTGFDYPELDTVLIARPTKSLALYYQMVGRAIRPGVGKDGWIVDMCGNIDTFGEVSDLNIDQYPNKGNWCVRSKGKQLTNVRL